MWLNQKGTWKRGICIISSLAHTARLSFSIAVTLDALLQLLQLQDCVALTACV